MGGRVHHVEVADLTAGVCLLDARQPHGHVEMRGWEGTYCVGEDGRGTSCMLLCPTSLPCRRARIEEGKGMVLHSTTGAARAAVTVWM